jgi:hypothetical protein
MLLSPLARGFLLLPLFFGCVAVAQAQLYTDASATLPSAAAMRPSMDVRAADLDADGDLDLVKANEGPPNTILLNNGTGGFTAAPTSAIPQESHDSEDVAIADFNGDGHLDLVFSSEDDVVQGFSNVHEYYLGDGAGHFTAAAYQPPDSEANAVITTDLNNDGHPDLLFGNNGTTTVLINNGAGGFTTENQRVPAIERTTQDLALADIDGDNDLDLFLGNEDGNLLFINDGNGFFTDATASRLPQGVQMETRKVTFGDVDGDEDADVFLSNVDFTPAGDVRQNRLYLNDGLGFFTDATATHLPADNDHTIDAIFEDVDLDFDPDLVVSNVFGGPVKIYLNDGSGVFTDMTFEVLGQLIYRDGLGVIAADLNGDGLRDLYFANRNNPQDPKKDVYLLRNAVSATQQPAAAAPAVRVYPNPVRDRFYIRAEKAALDSVVLLAADGKRVKSLTPKAVEKGVWENVLSGPLPAGAYVVEMHFSDGTVVRKTVLAAG